jgi:Membrane protein involved in the export of O-antigen and teichoic acid
MNTVTSHKRFLQGAAILAAASLISKILGVFYRVPYKAITGDVGLYAYAQVYPIYSTLLILATAGFPIAVSKIVAEKLAVGDVAGARRVFHVAAAFLSATGVACFALLFFGAPLIAALMGDPQLTMPIRMVSTALLVVPVMAAIRGYFQGQQNMMPTGVSQVLEQLVRIATILVLAIWAMETGRGVYAAASGALFGSFTGALAGWPSCWSTYATTSCVPWPTGRLLRPRWSRRGRSSKRSWPCPCPSPSARSSCP